METPRFSAINEGFQCDNCHRQVPPLRSSYRNHCPFCLTSKHVDRFPGDRLNDCGGLMTAVGYEVSGSKGVVLRFRCCVCGYEGRNRAALYGEEFPDDYDMIVAIKLV